MNIPTLSVLQTAGLKSRRITGIALFFLFVTGQVYVAVSFAESGSGLPDERGIMTPPKTTGILTTQGNSGITVNGTRSISGATILSGASIETPAGVRAAVSLVGQGSFEIEPSTKLTVEFDQSGAKAMLTEGCLKLTTKKGTTGEISTPQGSAGKTDPVQDGKLETCPRRSAAPIVAGGAGGLFSLGSAAAVSIIAEGVTDVVVPVAPRGILY